MSGSSLGDAVHAHVSAHFSGREIERLRPPDGGMVENIAELELVRVRGRERSPFVYVSAGAAAEPMEEGFGVEFFLLARDDSPDAQRLLAMVAHLHADPRYPLSLGQVLEIGHPWLPGASCDHLLVMLPGPFGDDFEWLSTTERTVRFVWLLPITADEAAFVRASGFGALQEKLGVAGVDPVDPARGSVV